MDQQKRRNLVVGVVLVLIGVWFLAVQFVPDLSGWIDITWSWPILMVAVGACLLLFGMLVGAPGMAVPAVIVAGIGGILYYQNLTGDWMSWSYLWTLIPGFVGVGIILAGLLGGNFRSSLSEGGGLVVISLILFFIFASMMGGWNLLGDYWPVLLILLGVWLLIRQLLRSR
jgi:hypothetical protein